MVRGPEGAGPPDAIESMVWSRHPEFSVIGSSIMKTATLLVGLLGATLLGTSALHAADPFVVPSFVKELEDLDEVMSDAARERKGITFLLMEPGST